MAPDVKTVHDFLADLAELHLLFKKLLSYKQLPNKMRAQTLGYDLLFWKTQTATLSQEALKPYFPAPKVIQARLFSAYTALISLNVKLLSRCTLFWVRRPRSSSGWVDLYARTGKRGGAWMSGFLCKLFMVYKNQFAIWCVTTCG